MPFLVEEALAVLWRLSVLPLPPLSLSFLLFNFNDNLGLTSFSFLGAFSLILNEGVADFAGSCSVLRFFDLRFSGDGSGDRFSGFSLILIMLESGESGGVVGWHIGMLRRFRCSA